MRWSGRYGEVQRSIRRNAEGKASEYGANSVADGQVSGADEADGGRAYGDGLTGGGNDGQGSYCKTAPRG